MTVMAKLKFTEQALLEGLTHENAHAELADTTSLQEWDAMLESAGYIDDSVFMDDKKRWDALNTQAAQKVHD